MEKYRLYCYFSLIGLAFAGVIANPMLVTAQIQASQEPRHHKVFENDWVRILDVHIRPGDTTRMHKHSTPSAFIVLSNTKTGSQVLVEPAKANFSDSRIWFESFSDKPRIHRVWNSDTVEFHVVDMEFPHTPNREIDPPMRIPYFTPLFDEKVVRGYRASLPAKEKFTITNRVAPVIVMGLTENDGELLGYGKQFNKNFRKKGDYLFIPAGETVVFLNKGTATGGLAVFELK